MNKRYSDLVITDDIFDENMERTAEENGFSHLQFLKFVENYQKDFQNKIMKMVMKNGFV